MSTAVATREDQIAARIDKTVTAVMAVGEAGITFATAGEVMEYAKMMATSGSAVPQHLRGQPGACLGIIDDAMRFKMSPYALARKSFFVNNNLAYEAQVLAALVIARAPVKQRPLIEYLNDGALRRCRVSAEFTDGAMRDYLSPPISQINPKNSPLWKTDPDQQLAYYSTRAFARRHCPDVLLGIYDPDELAAANMRDVTPARPSLAARLKVADGAEGFSAEHVDAETGEVTEEDPETEAGAGGAASQEAASLTEEKSEDAASETASDDADQAAADEAEETLLDKGRLKAVRGLKALNLWIGGLTPAEMEEVAPHIAELRKVAEGGAK